MIISLNEVSVATRRYAALQMLPNAIPALFDIERLLTMTCSVRESFIAGSSGLDFQLRAVVEGAWGCHFTMDWTAGYDS